MSNVIAAVDEGLQQYMSSLFSKVGLGLGLAGLLSVLVGTVPAMTALFVFSPMKWVLLLGTLGLCVWLSLRYESMSTDAVRYSYWGMTGLIGLSLGSIFLKYNVYSIIQVFFITSSVFLSASLYGYVTKKDLTSMGSFFIIGAIGLVLAGLVNIFLQSSALMFAINAIAVVIFTGLTAYDVQSQKELYLSHRYEDLTKVSYMGALSLFLNFINIFQALLGLLGQKDD